MSILIRDDTAVKELSEAIGIQDVRTPDGRCIGQFIPAPRPGMSIPELGIPDDELEAQINNPNTKWHSAEEVMARLREIDRWST